MKTVIQRGAEAVLSLGVFDRKKALVKERVKKGYRVPELDTRIRERRTRQEAELLSRARRAGVLTPGVLDTGKDRITMEWVEGKTVKDVFNGLSSAKRAAVSGLIGEAVAKLHSAGIIHGDLTTSNMILAGDAREPGQGENRLFLVDFGLGKLSRKVEDQAVDLHLLFEALCSTHFQYLEEAWANVLKVYKQKYLISNIVVQRIEEIRKRRRYA